MVFQTYAIWPHMDVFNNVAYPLQIQKVSPDIIKERVAKTLDFVQLSGFEKRPATKLSGGQQQRVALARALVAEPKVILFDEPLSNLDAKLREETRKELKTFLSELKITAIYVTHDRVEALALSDIIAVMRAGDIVEQGDPKRFILMPKADLWPILSVGPILFRQPCASKHEYRGGIQRGPIGLQKNGCSRGNAAYVVSAPGIHAPAGRERFRRICRRPQYFRAMWNPLFLSATLMNAKSGLRTTFCWRGQPETSLSVGEQVFLKWTRIAAFW